MAAVNVNAFKPVEAQLVLSLDDLIKQRREANKQETKATKKTDGAKSAKQKPGKAKNSNAAPLAQKKKQNKKVNAKPATQEVAATTLTPSQRKRLRKKKSKAAAAPGDAKSTGSPTKAQNKNQPKKQQNNNQPKKQQNNTLPNKQQSNNQPKKQQNNNQPKKQQNNNQLKKQSNQQPQQSQQKKKNVQIKIQRGNGGAAQKTISPSNNKTKASQNQDKRNVLFNVTMNGGKGLSLGKQRNGKKEHPVKRLLGNHIANKKSNNTKGGAGKPKMALKRRGNKKAT